jgi:hypothetical protein
MGDRRSGFCPRQPSMPQSNRYLMGSRIEAIAINNRTHRKDFEWGRAWKDRPALGRVTHV